ncbi:hypothetical protein AALP_AA8G158300 [Arabis alpina]|uniref:Thaumatin-like protein n=1 Tax=Arabis alpina TaxID=50452 RepID=A0A087G7C1_ARAAL|nr:hypothetical protein AALP_AA8G158300 [Arabis alpina]
MAKRLTLIFLIASHLFVSGVTSNNLTIENKCDYTVWPGILTSIGSLSTSTSGFALKKGESRAIHAPSLWSGQIWGRTLCSINSTGKFSCATGDCNSGEIECSGRDSNSPRSLVELSIDGHNINSYRVSVVDGYNFPLQVVPQRTFKSERCTDVSCDVVDLNQLACPYELMVVDEEERPIACTNPCRISNCYTSSSYTQIFKNACPTARVDNGDNNYFACPSSTDYFITFCPSLTPIPTR